MASLLGFARGLTTLPNTMISGSVRTLQTVGSVAKRAGGSTALVSAPKALRNGLGKGANVGSKGGAGGGLSKLGLAMALGGGGLGAYLLFGRKPRGGAADEGAGDGTMSEQEAQLVVAGVSSLVFLACCCCCCILVLMMMSSR